MIPLCLTDATKEHRIQKISGNPEVKKHLETLGFTIGEKISLISTLKGSVIVKVKDSRVAIGEDMARKIMVTMEDRQ